MDYSPWPIDPTVTYLNHGSFGACPRPVLEEQARIRERMERNLMRFFVRDYEELVDSAKRELATFVGADPADLAFVTNATAGVNTILRSMPFNASDEILITNHEYNACRNVANTVANDAGAKVVVAEIPFPLQSAGQVVERILDKVTTRTRLALIDHVTSQTGLIFPIEEIVRELSRWNVEVLVDGAHAPGMLPLELDRLEASYFTGNCYKWICAPKGAAFLWVRKDRQDRIRPLTISHGANSLRTDRSRYRLEFDWIGTMDPSAYLSIPAAIRFMGSLLPGGWTELRSRNRSLALAARKTLCDVLEIDAPSPEDMIGSLAAVPFPDADSSQQPLSDSDPIQRELYERYSIEVPIQSWPAPPKRVLRVSAQFYNQPKQYEYLAESLRTLLTNP